ncbi:leucine-rich repeat and immunoglobulin-like domain containing-NOGO receptor-interacting protein 4 [Bombina bombina]|uniref:leucine-rich repeat and immunoglobulin-like domain containing-NOGO receptor-interacting protein 4 n=1 Tax=Bombina bombina TaxID=8345 RepID=UPI00235ACC12|nr:leucine-rich repeat and immunoglobulin-like domain containing-NOGO receptor-interacting protein 4 [Bombina bombina]
MTVMQHAFQMFAPILVVITGVLCRSLCFCCPLPCECPPLDNATLCRHRLLSLVPLGIPPSSYLLDLSYNNIQLVLPDSFLHLHNLKQLDLSHNQLSRLEPGVFAGLPSLRILLLHHNQIKLLSPGVFLGMPDLSWLDVRANELVILLDQTFQGLQELKHLEAGENPLLFVSHKSFNGMRNLQRLGMEETKLSNVPSRALSALTKLSDLRLGGVSSFILRDLAFPGLKWLRVLDIDHWPSLRYLEPLSLSGLNLTSLSLTRCNFSSVPEEALRYQFNLRRLDLSHNPITAVMPKGLSTLQSLEELRLSGGKIHMIPSAAFHGLDHLRMVDLSNNPIIWLAEDVLPPALSAMEIIFLSGTALSCDCRLCWLLHRKVRFGGRPPICAAPDPLKGMVIPDNSDLLCPELFMCQPPKIVESGPRDLRVQEGEGLTISCHSQGVPEPSIHWVLPQNPWPGGTGKDEPVTTVRSIASTEFTHFVSSFTGEIKQHMESATYTPKWISRPSLVTAETATVLERVTILPEGSLQFRQVQAQDTGAYLCLVSNVAGNDSVWVHLEVTPFNGSMATTELPILHAHILAVITAGGILPFISSVTLCFIFIFLWSRGRGNIKHTVTIDYIPRATQGATETDDNKFTMKLL